MHVLRLGRLALVLAPYPPSIKPGIPPVYGDGTYQGGFAVTHVGLHVDSVEDAVESVRRRGSTILPEPKENRLRFTYVGAPAGVIIELLEYDGTWATLRAPQPA